MYEAKKFRMKISFSNCWANNQTKYLLIITIVSKSLIGPIMFLFRNRKKITYKASKFDYNTNTMANHAYGILLKLPNVCTYNRRQTRHGNISPASVKSVKFSELLHNINYYCCHYHYSFYLAQPHSSP
jgi:hypothetical protein